MVRSDKLDQPDDTYIMQTKEYRVWYNADDGGNNWVGPEDEVTNHKNTSKPYGVLAGSFTFEYTEAVDGEYIVLMSYDVTCKAWESEDQYAIVTLGKEKGKTIYKLEFVFRISLVQKRTDID